MPRYGERREVEINGQKTIMFIDYSSDPRTEKRCIRCGKPAPFLCDGDMGNGKTCDNPVCGYHTYRPNALEDKDLCPLCRAKGIKPL